MRHTLPSSRRNRLLTTPLLGLLLTLAAWPLLGLLLQRLTDSDVPFRLPPGFDMNGFLAGAIDDVSAANHEVICHVVSSPGQAVGLERASRACTT